MTRIGIIGGGNMGEALLKGLLERGRFSRRALVVAEVDAARRSFLKRRYRVRVTADSRQVVRQSGLILLAVKPQEFPELLEEIGPLVRGKRVISIAAGIPTRWIEKRLGKVPVVRAMPNLPARIGEGVSAVAGGRFAGRVHLKEAVAIFRTVGEVVELPERHLDAVTALSGSGPAYVAYLVKAFTEAACREGLPRAVAVRLILQTFLGSSRYLLTEGTDPDQFIRKVASKGGTTEAALSVFRRERPDRIFQKALKAAIRRSKTLSRRS